jgi:sulfotransferase
MIMNTHQLYFISGLPRSGSTLLANILAQNPAIHTTPTSACHDVMFVVKNNWKEWIEHKASKDLSDEENLRRVLNAILYSYHGTDRSIVIDKGRGWVSMMEMLDFAMGDHSPKVLVPVRKMSQIVASFEKLHRKNIHAQSDRGDFYKAQTIRGRSEELLSEKGVIGLAYNRIKDALERGWGKNMFFVEFEDLTNDPKKTMFDIYNFLGLPQFNHDFDNVEQYTHEDDSVHGFQGLHTIRSKVEPVRDDSVEILGDQFVEEFINTEFWRT